MREKKIESHKRAFGYARVSREDPKREKWSIPAQRERISQFCALRGYGLVSVAEDRNISGSTPFEERPGWLAISVQVKSGDVIVVNDLTRLGRNLIMTLQKLDDLQEQDIDVASLDNDFDTASATGKLVLQIMLSISEYERARTIERLHQVHTEIHRQGRVLGCRPPYGYDYDQEKKEFIVIEEEAIIVRRLFDLKASGYGLATIARLIQAEGVPTKRGSKQWTPQTVRRIIANEINVGLRTYNGETREYDAPSIVDMETYKAAQATLGVMPYSKRREYLLSGLLRCSRCEGPLYRVQFREKRSPEEQGVIKGANWRCRNAIQFKTCAGTSIRESIAEEGVTKLLFSALDSDKFEEAVARREEYVRKQDKHIESVRRKLEIIERKQSRLLDEFTKDDTTVSRSAFAKKSQEHVNQIENLERTIETLVKELTLAQRPVDGLALKAVWENLDVVARREAIRVFIDYVSVLPPDSITGIDRLKPVWKYEV